MPLLLDGEPFRLDDLAHKEFGRNFTYMMPMNKASRNRNTGHLELPHGIGIPAEYRFIEKKSNKECTLRYFEFSRWDDTLRKEVYTPEQIMIGDRGIMPISSNQAELNFFLHNHPGLEHGEQRKRYPRYPIIFALKNKPKQGMMEMEKWKIKKEMESYIDPENPKAWKFDKLVAACQALANDTEFASIPPNLRLPSEVLNYREVEEMNAEEREAYEVVLRMALLNIIAQHPHYAMDRLIKSLDREMLTIINRASRTEFTNFKFDTASSTWVEFEKDKWSPVLKVKQSANPNMALCKEMKADPKFEAKITAIANRAGN
jgi:hypothetical protein